MLPLGAPLVWNLISLCLGKLFLNLVPLDFLEERENILEEYASECSTEKCSVKKQDQQRREKWGPGEGKRDRSAGNS